MDRKKFWEWMKTCPTKDWRTVEDFVADKPVDKYNYDYVDISFAIKEGDGND